MRNAHSVAPARRAVDVCNSCADRLRAAWPPCDATPLMWLRRLGHALSSTLLGTATGSRPGRGEGGVVAASQRGVCLRDWHEQGRTASKGLGNGSRPEWGPRKGCSAGANLDPRPDGEILQKGALPKLSIRFEPPSGRQRCFGWQM